MTRIWRQLYSIAFWNADAWFISTGLPDGPATLSPGISYPRAQNSSEFPEFLAQSFRNPQPPYRHRLSSIRQFEASPCRPAPVDLPPSRVQHSASAPSWHTQAMPFNHNVHYLSLIHISEPTRRTP